MSAQLAIAPMDVDAFYAWAEGQEGRFELDAGTIVAMAPERLVHGRTKLQIVRALADAIGRAGVPCEAIIDSVAIRIDRSTSYQPDALVQCGPALDGDVREADAPVVVVEVLSPSTAYRDLGRKARNYFRVPSVAHYLVVDADERVVLHHRRGESGGVLTCSLTDGTLTLDPPGLEVDVADLLPRPPAPAAP